MEYILARMLRNVHVWILETTHTCHSTKVVIKGAVLLHEDHNVLDLLQLIVNSHRGRNNGKEGCCRQPRLSHREHHKRRQGMRFKFTYARQIWLLIEML